MSAAMSSDLGARVPATTEMEGAAAGGGDGAVTTPPSAPTCPVCMEPWTCNGDHRICCIPCGHVYGRSCLERWLHRSGNETAKCPQCGEQFEQNLIINLYAPGNLWDGCCRFQESTTKGSAGIALINQFEKFLVLLQLPAKGGAEGPDIYREFSCSTHGHRL